MAQVVRTYSADYFLHSPQLEYFETILNPYFTHDARESLKSLQGVLLEKAIESVTESVETPHHQRRATRGSDDAMADDRQSGSSASPDDLIVRKHSESVFLLFYEIIHFFSNLHILAFKLLFGQALAQQCSSELLQSELERTRLNTACFEESLPLDSLPESAKAAYAPFRGSMDSPSRNYRNSPSFVGSPSYSRQRRR